MENKIARRVRQGESRKTRWINKSFWEHGFLPHAESTEWKELFEHECSEMIHELIHKLFHAESVEWKEEINETINDAINEH